MRRRIDPASQAGNDRYPALGQLARDHQRGIQPISGTAPRTDDRYARPFETFIPRAFYIQHYRRIIRLAQERRIYSIVEHKDVAAELSDPFNLGFSAFVQFA